MKEINAYVFLMIFTLALTTRVEVKDLYESLNITYTEKIYSGYLKTGVEGNEHFYILTKSQKEDEKRLLIYLDGGPGCSAFGNFLTETGPVITTLYAGYFRLNKHAWNKNINVLYIESPAGTGFTKNNDPEQLYDDNLTAKYHLESFLNFFNEFPEYRHTDIYFAGESYGGVYVPNLIKAIYSRPDLSFNIKGVIIGNGVTTKLTDIERSMVEFGHGNGVVSTELKDEYNKHCPIYSLDESKPYDSTTPEVSVKCNELRKEIKDCFEGSDIFGLYNVCKTLPPSDEEMPEISLWPSFCDEDMSVTNFLNSVKHKLGVDPSINWVSCNFNVRFHYTLGDSYAIYRDILFKHKIKVWFYSGDTDLCVPTLGSMKMFQSFNMGIKKEFQPWRLNGKIAGFYQVYDNDFTFITIKGAGHMPPQQKKPEMKAVLDYFLGDGFPQ